MLNAKALHMAVLNVVTLHVMSLCCRAEGVVAIVGVGVVNVTLVDAVIDATLVGVDAAHGVALVGVGGRPLRAWGALPR